MEHRLFTCDNCGKTATQMVNTSSLPEGWWSLNASHDTLFEVHQRRKSDQVAGLTFCSLPCVGEFGRRSGRAPETNNGG